MTHASVLRTSSTLYVASRSRSGYHCFAVASPWDMRSPICTSACWIWRGCLSSCKYSVIFEGERCRPNHVLHQNKNGISTINHATKKNSRRLRTDMWCRGFGLAAGSAAVGLCELGDINGPDG